MEDRETPRMRKYGESKTTRIMMELYRTSLPVRDLENFRPMDFRWTECTTTRCVTAQKSVFLKYKYKIMYKLC